MNDQKSLVARRTGCEVIWKLLDEGDGAARSLVRIGSREILGDPEPPLTAERVEEARYRCDSSLSRLLVHARALVKSTPFE